MMTQQIDLANEKHDHSSAKPSTQLKSRSVCSTPWFQGANAAQLDSKAQKKSLLAFHR
jgi:hypothetical protein